MLEMEAVVVVQIQLVQMVLVILPQFLLRKVILVTQGHQDLTVHTLVAVVVEHRLLVYKALVLNQDLEEMEQHQVFQVPM